MIELEWNKIPKRDYYYFVTNRFVSHTWWLLKAYPQNNGIYFCFKKNEDGKFLQLQQFPQFTDLNQI